MQKKENREGSRVFEKLILSRSQDLDDLGIENLLGHTILIKILQERAWNLIFYMTKNWSYHAFLALIKQYSLKRNYRK